ncbi:flagellar motility protein MotE (MotC chaperone) [Mesorhizobium shonense]|uniref:Flagellar motility protein MotE (MotC chaperone) n=1 Tax=Mesorhizobium shonense TaxID=1209948 RepID=A0ABV2HSY1_9HYPH
MRLQHILIPAALCSLVAASAYSEETDRYRLEKSANGYVRMDTQTGAMSICEEHSGQLVCKMAADERAAFQDEIDRLQNSVKALDERVTRLENTPSARLESNLPSEEDFNKTMNYMERFFRRFMDIVKDMDRENGDGGAKPDPQKT